MMCPENTYSVSGILIDGLMGDWDNSTEVNGGTPKEMEFSCYYLKEFNNWIENEQC